MAEQAYTVTVEDMARVPGHHGPRWRVQLEAVQPCVVARRLVISRGFQRKEHALLAAGEMARAYQATVLLP